MPRLVKALRVLLVVVVLAPVIASGAAPLSAEQERVFHSGDVDLDPEEVDGDIENGATYAKVADVPYRTTKPQYEIDDTSLLEHQRESLNRLDTGLRRSRVLPFSETKDGSMIEDAHVTFLGVHGGAKPRLGTGVVGGITDEYPLFVGDSGKVLSHADFRVDGSVPPEDYCTDASYDTELVDIPGDGSDVKKRVYLDGSRTCYEFELETEVDRTVRFSEDGRIAGGGDVISYSGLDSNEKQTLTVSATVHVHVERIVKSMDWTPNEPFPTDPGGGFWYQAGSTTDPNYRTDHVSVSDSADVLVTDAGSLDVSQTVIEVDDDTKHVVLTFDGPRGSDAVDRDQLTDRLLWSYVAFGDEQFVDGTWGTYSVRQYGKTFLHSDGGREREDDPPSVPRVFLLGMDRQPTVDSTGGATRGTTVIGFEGYDVQTTQSVQDRVALTPKRPLAYSRLVVANAPSEASDLITLHGKTIDVDVEDRVEYRRPEIMITATGDSNELRIHVEDPETGDPLTGRRVYLYGADPQSTTGGAVTDGDGDLTVTRTNTFVRARTERDDWRNPSGDVFYDEASASATFLPDVLLVQRFRELVFSIVLFSPLVLLYFYVRHFGFFE